jgi:hypothetical protein
MLCQSCVASRKASAEDEAYQRFKALNDERHAAALIARKRIRRAWIVGGLFGFIGGPLVAISSSQGPNVPSGGATAYLLMPFLVLLYMYTFGSMALVLPRIWQWWCRLVAKFSFLLYGGCIFWFVAVGFFVTIPLWFAAVYSLFGGGIYEYVKNRRIAAEITPPSAVTVPAA